MDRVRRGLAWGTLLFVALLLGGQAFDTLVLVPLWTESPAAFHEYYAAANVPPVPLFFGVVVPGAVLFGGSSFLINLRRPSSLRFWSGVTAGLLFLHLIVVFFWFIPTNQQLGLLETVAPPPELSDARLASLLWQWSLMNKLRLLWEALALIGAAKALQEARLPSSGTELKT